MHKCTSDNFASAANEMWHFGWFLMKYEQNNNTSWLNCFDHFITFYCCHWLPVKISTKPYEVMNRRLKIEMFFFCFLPPPPALFIQLLCRRGHKFCSRAICFSKAQYKCHTQGSEVQALVCLMHNLYWSTPSFVLSSWPHPQAHCLYQIIYPVEVISKRFSAVHYKYLAKTCTQHDYIHALLFLMLSKPQFNWE